MPKTPFSSDRRQFLQASSAAFAATGLFGSRLFANESDDAPFKISLAEWSLHRTLRDASSGVTNMDFPGISKNEFGIDGVEYVNQFFKDKAKDNKYLAELKTRCKDLGVNSVLIMVDGEGALGDPDDAKRKQAVENHYQWVDAAKFLGCHSIRVNASSRGSYEEQQKLAADGLRKLSEYAAPQGLGVIVENHGGLSSNGKWLSDTIKMVGLDNCGTLPDFGNFFVNRNPPEWFDNYEGVELMMPYAKAVSAKTHDFAGDFLVVHANIDGKAYQTDYEKMMSIVLSHGYHGYVGIEYEGGGDEYEGIRKSKALLERVAAKLSQPVSAR
ncbi:sugar phosphate isomerase/epimerase family protein [Novipirellula artificiosorum]|uniref:Xylose isomerase-like TIM barrel n=1 Tax=Novipirellula artificiosorum TaxID=2528016 RepID=A0A5C6DEH4_9BACT|nr:sugar phosphate isomerase/epimerase family protein [Novipirellula artificiosorum]TWU34217.1 Xylose isomerase-like TIM barrel [Novipirellula artificiosorum]